MVGDPLRPLRFPGEPPLRRARPLTRLSELIDTRVFCSEALLRPIPDPCLSSWTRFSAAQGCGEMIFFAFDIASA